MQPHSRRSTGDALGLSAEALRFAWGDLRKNPEKGRRPCRLHEALDAGIDLEASSVRPAKRKGRGFRAGPFSAPIGVRLVSSSPRGPLRLPGLHRRKRLGDLVRGQPAVDPEGVAQLFQRRPPEQVVPPGARLVAGVVLDRDWAAAQIHLADLAAAGVARLAACFGDGKAPVLCLLPVDGLDLRGEFRAPAQGFPGAAEIRNNQRHATATHALGQLRQCIGHRVRFGVRFGRAAALAPATELGLAHQDVLHAIAPVWCSAVTARYAWHISARLRRNLRASLSERPRSNALRTVP